MLFSDLAMRPACKIFIPLKLIVGKKPAFVDFTYNSISHFYSSYDPEKIKK
jgi:hypothetical protein